MTIRRFPAAILSAALLFSSCGGLRTISKDGYRASLVYSTGERYQIAIRGEWGRVEGTVDGAPLVKVLRPDLKKTWQFRPSSRRLFEEAWGPADEIVPGYPLEPRFDSQAYAGRFHGEMLKIADAAFAGHPCDRYQMDLPSGDRVILWAARDYERLPVRVEHQRRKGEEEYEPGLDVRLVDIQVGADPDLFQKPKGYRPVASYEDLRRQKS
ncbi:MAG: hypothetical protein ABJC07_00875 [Acidobacteriota bacterium]